MQSIVGGKRKVIHNGRKNQNKQPLKIHCKSLLMMKMDRWLNVDYWKEVMMTLFIGEGFIIFLSIVAYNRLVWILPLQILLFPIHRILKQRRVERLKIQYMNGFREVMQSLLTSLQTGYSMENACRVCLREMTDLYQSEKNPTVRQLQKIVHGIELHRTVDQMFMEYAKETKIEEIYEFAVVLHIAKDTGGNIVDILKNSIEHFQNKMEVEEEVRVNLSGRIFEKNIMLLMPMGVLLYLRLANPGYVDSLYNIPAGNLLVTIVIAGTFFCFFWTEKIMNIAL